MSVSVLLTVVKLGITVVSALIVAALLQPLILFFIDVITNPIGLIQLKAENVKYSMLNQTAKVRLVLIYNGSVTLTNVRIEWLGGSLYFDKVSKGVYERTITIPISSLTTLQDMLAINVSFSIGGLYPVFIRIERSG